MDKRTSNNIKNVCLCFLCVALFSDIATGKEAKFTSLRFLGLNNVSKYEIIKDADVKVTNEEILADVDILKRSIARHPLVQDATVASEGNVLTVTVTEKPVLAFAAIIAGNFLMPAIIGEDFFILSMSQHAACMQPIFVADRKEVIGDRISSRFADICLLIKNARIKYPALVKEIEEVRLLDGNEIEIRLRKRPLACRMRGNADNIGTLNYVVGYLDGIKHYPLFLYIDGDLVVMR